MTAGMGIRLDPSPGPSAAQWSLSSRAAGAAHLARRTGVVRCRREGLCGPVNVRASRNSQDGDGAKKNVAATGLSRRSMVALMALSAQFLDTASARAENVSETMRREMMSNIQQRQKTAPPAIVEAEAPPAAEVSTPPQSPPPAAATLVGVAVGESLAEVPSALADLGAAAVEASATSALQETATRPVSEIAAGGNFGLELLNSVGILGGGVVGALYLLERQAKADAESALEVANTKLKEAGVSMASFRETTEGQLRAEKEQAQKAASIAQQQRTTLANELVATKVSATELQRKLETEKAAAENLQLRISRLQSMLEDEEKSYDSLNARFEAEKAAGEGLGGELRALQAQVEARDTEIGVQGAKIAEGEATATALRAELHAMSAAQGETIASLEGDLAADRKKIGHLEGELAADRETIRNLEGERAADRETIGSLEGKLATHRETIGSLEGERTSLQDAKNELEQLRDDLVAKLAAANGRKEELAAEVGRLNAAVDSLALALREEQAKKEQLGVELTEASEALARATAEAQSLQHRLTETLAAKDALKKEKEREVEELTGEIQERSEALDLAVASNQSLCDEVAALKSRQEALNGELENAHNELEASTDEIKTITEQLTVAVKLSLKLEAQLNEARAAYQSTSAALGEERKVTAAAKNQLAASQKALVAEKGSVKALRASVDQALQALQELNRDSVAIADELDRAKKQVASLEAEGAALRQKLAKEKDTAAGARAGAAHAATVIAKLTKDSEAASKKAKLLEGELAKVRGESVQHKGKLVEMKRALQLAESRLKTIPQVRAEATLLVEKYEDLAFQEREQKEALLRQNEQLLKLEKSGGTNLAEVKQSLEDGQAARSEMEAALGSLQEAVAETPS